jgi:hypothetical protein
MPNNYIASLRLAQIEFAANHFDETIAACDRGLARAPGASGRAWLLQLKARALEQNGKLIAHSRRRCGLHRKSPTKARGTGT